jgi:hypothetical protein
MGRRALLKGGLPAAGERQRDDGWMGRVDRWVGGWIAGNRSPVTMMVVLVLGDRASAGIFHALLILLLHLEGALRDKDPRK